MRFTHSLAVLAFLGAVSAHFTLDFPYTRGFDENKEPDVPCGGFPVNKTRTLFPLSGGFISFSSFHNTASSVAGVSFSSDPKSLNDFNTTASNQTYPLLLPTFSTSVEGSFCVQVNVSNLGVSGVTNGTLATILMVYNGGDGLLHQCSDVVLVRGYSLPSSIPCKNSGTVTGGSTTSSPQSTSSPTGTHTSSPTSSTTKGAASSLTVPNSGLAAVIAFVTSLLL